MKCAQYVPEKETTKKEHPERYGFVMQIFGIRELAAVCAGKLVRFWPLNALEQRQLKIGILVVAMY